MPEEAYGYALVAAGKRLERRALELSALPAGWVVVRVAGCGVCHTDVGFAAEGVPPRHPLPLVLGHEIAGVVERAGPGAEAWLGRRVIVPAVIPCGECPACRAGRPTICPRQFMPGNDGHGGFATHVRVPARGLCPVPDPLPAGLELADLAVVADAVTTPFEAIRRSGLEAGEVTVFVGVGGIGAFGVQIASALGAQVIAVDVDPERLRLVAEHGACETWLAGERPLRELRQALRERVRASGRPGTALKIFETSGTAAGQETAFGLLDFGAYLGVVGYTPEKIALRLSNLMAFDATARGNWGCPPEVYPEALALVLEGRVKLRPFTERHALDEAPGVLEAVRVREIRRRVVLVPPAGR